MKNKIKTFNPLSDYNKAIRILNTNDSPFFNSAVSVSEELSGDGMPVR